MAKILCIIDGMTDPAFCADNYPALASFPERSYINTVPSGFEAETLPCVLSLLGIKPPHHIRGRIEALGAGVDVNPTDLVFRGSWVSLDSNGICTRFCNAPQNIPKLEKALYVSLGGYKSLLVIPGYASCVDSIQAVLPFNMLRKRIDDHIYADIPLLKNVLTQINNVAHNRAIILWAASSVQPMPNFSQYATVCGANVIRGIAKALKMTLVSTVEMTGDTDTNLKTKLHSTLRLAEKCPFVMLHIGSCDEASHRMDKQDKHAFLSKIDDIVLSALLMSNHTVVVVSDHGCDPLTGRHTSINQPYFNRPK